MVWVVVTLLNSLVATTVMVLAPGVLQLRVATVTGSSALTVNALSLVAVMV